MNFKGLQRGWPLVFAAMVFLGALADAQAQTIVEEDPAAVYPEVTSVNLERPFWLAFRIYPKPGQYVPYVDPETGDKGLVAEIALPDGFIKGETLQTTPSRVFDGTVFGYDQPFWVLQEIIPGHGAEFHEKYTFPGQASWSECNENNCADYEKEISVELPYGPGLPSITKRDIFQAARGTLPSQLAWPVRFSAGGGRFRLQIFAGKESQTLAIGEILPSQGIMLSNINDALEAKVTNQSVAFEGRPVGYLPRAKFEGLLLVPGVPGRAFILDVKNGFETEPRVSLSSPGLTGLTIWLALGLAFLGGLILNLMPCVFPVLTLKVFSLVKAGSASKRALKVDGLAYTAGILATFAFVALLLLTFRELGQQVGWGFQLQSPYFVTFLGLLLFLVSLNFAGVFEFSLALSVPGRGREGGALGSFYTGMLATVVATPCTAPFMAPALGFALTLSKSEALLVFLMLGFGMALPYLLISFIPKIQKIFPKPGPWMVRFKKILALPLLLTVGWLVWVLSTQIGEAGIAAFILYAALLLGLILGWKKRRALVWQLRILALALFVAGGGGLIFATLPVYKNVPEKILPEGGDVVAWSDEAVWNLRLQGKGVFVNYTANWCLTCKVNEKLVFSKEKFQRYLDENNIVYMEADWTNYDEAISISLEGLGRNALPVFVFYPQGGPTKDPVLLPEILTLEETLEILAANGS